MRVARDRRSYFKALFLLTLGALAWMMALPKLVVSPTDYVTNAYGVGSDDLLNPARLALIRFMDIGVDRWDAAGNSPLVYAVYYDNERGILELTNQLSCEHLKRAAKKIEEAGIARQGYSVLRDRISKCRADKISGP